MGGASNKFVDSIIDSRVHLNKIPGAANSRIQSHSFPSRETNIKQKITASQETCFNKEIWKGKWDIEKVRLTLREHSCLFGMCI